MSSIFLVVMSCFVILTIGALQWMQSNTTTPLLANIMSAFIGYHNGSIFILGGGYPTIIEFDIEQETNKTVGTFNGKQMAQSSVQKDHILYYMAYDEWDIVPFNLHALSMETHFTGYPGNAIRGRCLTDIGSHILVIGGDYNNEMIVLDISTRIWTNGTSMPAPRAYHSCNTINNNIYVIGGYDDEMSAYRNTVFKMNVTNCCIDDWYQLNHTLRNIKGYHRSVVYKDAIYVVGGRHSSGYFDDVDIVDTQTDVISYDSVMLYPKESPSVIIVDNVLFVFGGYPITKDIYYQYAMIPTYSPTLSPSRVTSTPSISPTLWPSGTTSTPSISPTLSPSRTTSTPSISPTISPSGTTSTPSISPTLWPSGTPSSTPTSATPTSATADPTTTPSSIPLSTSTVRADPSTVIVEYGNADSNVECIWQNNARCSDRNEMDDIVCCAQYIHDIDAFDSNNLGQDDLFNILTIILIISVIGFIIDILWLFYSIIVYFTFNREWEKAENIILPMSICSTIIDIAFTFTMFGIVIDNDINNELVQLREHNCFSIDAIDEIINVEGLLDNIVVGNSVQGILDVIGIGAILYFYFIVKNNVKEETGIGWTKSMHYFISVVIDLLLGGINTFYFTLTAYNQFTSVYSYDQYLCYTQQ